MRLSLIISWLWASTVIASPTRPTKSIAGVTVIDTPLVQAAQQYTRAHSDDFTFNQNVRTWLCGVTIYDRLKA